MRSDFGSIGDRSRATGRPVELPCHVWVRLPGASGWIPGLLVRWEAGDEGTWWGEVAIVGESGAAGLQMVSAAGLLPAATSTPLPWQ